jgi:hypothetical protein
MDPDPYRFKEVMYQKRYRTFYTSLLDFPHQKVQQDPQKRYSFLNSPFQLILLSSLEYRSLWIRIRYTRGMDPDPGK